MTSFEGTVLVLMVLCIGMVAWLGVMIDRVWRTLKARGLASPHVIVSTGNGGVMRGMKLDVSGPGYEDDPSLYIRGKCDVIGNVFNHTGGVQQKGAIPVIDDGKCSNEAWCPQLMQERSKYMKAKTDLDELKKGTKTEGDR
jgi:hypothetical protein